MQAPIGPSRTRHGGRNEVDVEDDHTGRRATTDVTYLAVVSPPKENQL
ncbi:unnamed protein product, partial [Rotaria sp. Silwood1]